MKKKEFKDFTTLSDQVKFLLETIPVTRDNDMKLISTFYLNQIGVEEIKSMSAYELLHKISMNEIASQESIMRTRRILQNENPYLRGEKYGKKKGKPVFQYVVAQR